MPKKKLKLFVPPTKEELEEKDEIETVKTADVEAKRKASATEDQIERVAKTDEGIKNATPIKNTYQVVNLGSGDRCRILGKAPNGNWVTPVILCGEAHKLCVNMNRKDPEQQRLLRDKAEAPVLIDTGEGTVENPRMIVKRQRK
ncbi:MAG: hypothetical protein ABIH92_05995 [Nanoarchaeota archaeon]